MKTGKTAKKEILITLMEEASGTSTSSEGLTLFYAMDKVLKAHHKVKLSLSKCTPLSTSFLNASFGEICDKYGFAFVRKNIVLTNYVYSQAMQIKKHLEELQKLVR